MSNQPESSHGAPVSRGKGILLVALAAMLWSGGGVGVKVLGVGAMSIAGFRSAFAAAFMLLAVLAFRMLTWDGVRACLRRPLVWVGAVAYAVMVMSFCIAAKKTTAANAIFIQYTGPIYVALLSHPLLGERVRPRDILATLACIVGMGLFFRGELSSEGQVGNLVAAVSSLGFAGLPLSIRREERALAKLGKRSPESPMIAMILGNAIAAVLSLPFMVQDHPTLGKEWLVLAGLGTLQIALPYLLYGIAVRALSALESSLVAMIEPVLSPLWVVFATGERPSRDALIGGTIIISAVLVRSVLPAARPLPAPSGGAASTDHEP